MGGGGGPHVGCRLKFHYFVACQLKFSTFIDFRENFGRQNFFSLAMATNMVAACSAELDKKDKVVGKSQSVIFFLVLSVVSNIF